MAAASKASNGGLHLTEWRDRHIFTPPQEGWNDEEKTMTTLKVTGMTCDHCENAVRRALEGVAGVARVIKVSREREQVVVEGSADPQDLIAAVQEEGYTAEVAS